jgi:hypothetical protein
MALALNNTRLISEGGSTGAGGDKSVRLWLLATEDNAAAVEGANACDVFAGHWQKGDIIMASMVRAGTPVGKSYIVTASSATAITIAPFVDNT